MSRCYSNIMCNTENTPLSIHFLKASQKKSSKTPILLQPTKNRFNLDRSPGTHLKALWGKEMVMCGFLHFL